MNSSTLFRGFRYPAEVIQQAVWLYHCFSLSDAWRHFGFTPADGETEADMGRRHAETFLTLLQGKGFAEPNPRPMFANPPGLLRIEPHAAGLRDRIWWGSSSNATAVWAAWMGMNLQSSTLKADESGERHCQVERARPAAAQAGAEFTPRRQHR